MGPYDILDTVICYVILTTMTENEMYPSKYWYMRAIILFAYEF